MYNLIRFRNQLAAAPETHPPLGHEAARAVHTV
jgi:hypothetical protein